MITALPAEPPEGVNNFHLISEPEAAKRLGISYRTLQAYRIDGRGPRGYA
jgi:hypothetical protein